MRFDHGIRYYNENKELLGEVLGSCNDLGAEKQNELFSAAGNQSRMKERHFQVITADKLPLRSGYLQIEHTAYTILKVIGHTIYAGEYHGRL